MEQGTVVVIFKILKRHYETDLEVPLSISANDFVNALNEGYNLGIDVADIKNCYLKAENPIALLRGNKTLEDYGIRDGSIIFFTE